MQNINITYNIQPLVFYIKKYKSSIKSKLLLLPFILLISCLFGFSSCTKDSEPELVPITTSGKNTMGFKIDGKVVNIRGAYYSGILCSCGVTGGDFVDGSSYVLGSEVDPNFTLAIYYPRDSLDSNNEVIINESVHSFEEIVYNDGSPLGGREYSCDDTHTGKVVILRTDDRILSGTFEFDAINKETGKVISVRDGRFDIKWR